MRRTLAAALMALCLGAAQPAAGNEDCPAGSGAVMAGAPDAPWTIAIKLDPKGVPLSAPFQAEITICPVKSGKPTRVTVDATMPAHKHGMNYAPTLRHLEEGRFEVRDLLFHMPGVWRFEVTAYLDGKPYRYVHDLTVQ